MHKCDNCSKEWSTHDLEVKFPDIPDLLKRIEPGDAVPSGECPSCGALVYPLTYEEGRHSHVRCKVCHVLVRVAKMREHLAGHNVYAWDFDWEDVDAQFEVPR